MDCVHFSEVEANPSTTTVDKIVWMYRLNNCDGFLAIGGGSPIDAAGRGGARRMSGKDALRRWRGFFRVLAACHLCRRADDCRGRARRRLSPPSLRMRRRIINTP